jgi:hypothetical protein
MYSFGELNNLKDSADEINFLSLQQNRLATLRTIEKILGSNLSAFNSPASPTREVEAFETLRR